MKLIRSVLVFALVSLWTATGIPTAAEALSDQQLQAAPSGLIPPRLTLDRAVEILLEHNLSILAARYGVEASRARRLAASFRPNPNLELEAEEFNLARPGRYLFATDPFSEANRVYTFRVSQVVERGRKRDLRTEATNFELQAQEASLLNTIRLRLFDLKQAYYQAVLAREHLRAAEENLQLFEDTERLIRTRVEAGDTAEWDLIRFQANKVEIQRELVSARLAGREAVLRLLLLFGADPEEIQGNATGGSGLPIEVIDDFRTESVSAPLEELRKIAFENHPAAIQTRRLTDASRTHLDLARSMRNRNVEVGLQYQRVGSDNTVGVTFSLPLFLSHDYRGEIQEAHSRLSQVRTEHLETELRVGVELEGAYEAYRSSREMLRIYTEETMRQAEESFRIATMAYQEGATSLLELLDTQRTYNRTRSALNEAQHEYTAGINRLEMALGTELP